MEELDDERLIHIPELENCPFCAWPPQINIEIQKCHDGKYRCQFSIECRDCKYIGSGHGFSNGDISIKKAWHKSTNDAVDWWNTRIEKPAEF